ncbi:MAG: hypothetical protein HQK54_12400 [Oligoflexales bacterium]|nr:hypothetical protein [Oligoflexales bacterium]
MSATCLGILIYPMWTLLDLLLVPNLWGRFFIIRIAFSLVVSFSLIAVRTIQCKRNKIFSLIAIYASCLASVCSVMMIPFAGSALPFYVSALAVIMCTGMAVTVPVRHQIFSHLASFICLAAAMLLNYPHDILSLVIPSLLICGSIQAVSYLQSFSRLKYALRDFRTYGIVSSIDGESFMTSQKQISHLIEQVSKIYYPHQIKMMLAGKYLEETMPVGKAEACIISFDVIGSSRIKHEKAKQFFRDIFAHCGEIMMCNYKQNLLVSNAYRIKEIGDGFLCSIGFPFKVPGEKTNAQVAVELAKSFVYAFYTHLSKLDYAEPIYCAVGIGSGEVEGFFPESKPMNYDLFGRGIVLATRYEQIRKILFEKLNRRGYVIILQDIVYNSLPKELRETFSEFDLVKNKIFVRDHKEAEKLYYYFFDEKALDANLHDEIVIL